MRFNKKGQGSIEYLMILAAVLAIAVVVVVLATTFFTRYRDPAEIAQDKSVCAASGIELKNYVDRFDCIGGYAASTCATGQTKWAHGNMSVEYGGKVLTCTGSMTLVGDSACKIGLQNGSCIRLYANRTHCIIDNTTYYDC